MSASRQHLPAFNAFRATGAELRALAAKNYAPAWAEIARRAANGKGGYVRQALRAGTKPACRAHTAPSQGIASLAANAADDPCSEGTVAIFGGLMDALADARRRLVLTLPHAESRISAEFGMLEDGLAELSTMLARANGQPQ